MAGVQAYIPSIKQLLPIPKEGADLRYLKNSNTNEFKEFSSLTDYATNTFLTDLNTSSNLSSLWNRTSKVYTIRGNKSTISSYTTRDTGKAWPRWVDGEPLWLSYEERYDFELSTQGDGTVLWESTKISGPSSEITNYQSTISESHAFIPRSQDTINYIFGELNLGIYDKVTPGTIWNSIAFDLQCPADLLIVDPLGRKIGYIGGQLINQIGADAVVMGEQGDGQFVMILNPIQGNYNISVLGQNEGTFDLYTWSTTQENTQGQRFSGYLEQGMNLNYSATFNPAEEQDLVVETPDNVAPTSAVTLTGLQGQNQWYTTPVEINLSTIDNPNGIGVAKIEYSFDGGQNWNDYISPIILNRSGVYDIKYRAVDFYGNEEPEKSVLVKVDLAPPTTTAKIEGQQGNVPWYVSDVQVYLQGTDDENGSGVNKIFYSLDAGMTWNTYSEPISLSNGQHSLVYKAIDAAGLVEADKNIEIWIDTIKPETAASIEGTKGNNGWFVSDVQLTLAATDNLSGISSTLYSLDNGNTWQTYSTPVLISDNGKNTILYKSIDIAGNIEDIKEISIWIDKVAPVTTLSLSGMRGNSPWFISDVNLVFDSADNLNGSGIEKIEYSYDGVSWNIYESNLVLDREGKTTVYYKATDKAGNEEFYRQQDIYIDKTAPTIDIISPAKNIYYLNEPLTANFIATDSVSGIQTCSASFNGEPVENGQSIVLDQIGPCRFIVEATDVAGNKNVQTIEFDVKYVIEWLPPLERKGKNSYNNNTTIPVKFSASDFYGVPQLDNTAKLIISGATGKDERIMGDGPDSMRTIQKNSSLYYMVIVKLKDYDWLVNEDTLDLTVLFNNFEQDTLKINIDHSSKSDYFMKLKYGYILSLQAQYVPINQEVKYV